MSKKVVNQRSASNNQHLWTQALRKLDAEIADDPSLTEAQKRFLLEEMDQLSDEEWNPSSALASQYRKRSSKAGENASDLVCRHQRAGQAVRERGGQSVVAA